MADETPTNPTPPAEGQPANASPAKPAAASSAAEAALRAAMQAVAELNDPQANMAPAPGPQQDAPPRPTMSAPEATRVDFPAFNIAAAPEVHRALDLLGDVNLNVKIELGRTRMLVEDVLRLGEGAIVELDKLAGDPVDVYVNERHVARGEVLVLNDNFCVRINEIIKPAAEEVVQKVG